MIEEQQIPKLLDGINFESLALTPEDFFVLSRINGILSVKEINQMVGFPIEKTLACMQKLLDNKVIELKVKEEKKKAPVVTEQTSFNQQLDLEDKDPAISAIPRHLRNRILLCWDGIEKKNFFEILEVTPSADAASIHKSYLKLVKEFHPDSLRGKESGHYKNKMEKIFEKIQEAYQEIHPDNKRAVYLHTLMDGRRTSKPKEEKPKYEYKRPPPKNVELKFADADTQFQMGVAEEKKGNLQAALNFYQMAMNLNPQRIAFEEAFHRVRKLMREGF